MASIAELKWIHTSLTHLDHIPQEEGVYSIRYSDRFSEDKVLYIGRSYNIRQRLDQQRALISKAYRDRTETEYGKGVAIYYAVTNISFEIEKELIRTFLPRYNKFHNRNYSKIKPIVNA